MHGFKKYKDSLPPEFYRRIKNLYDGKEDIKTLPALKAYWLWLVKQRTTHKHASSFVQGLIAQWGRGAVEYTSIYPKIRIAEQISHIHDEFLSLEWPWLGSEASKEENDKHADEWWEMQKRDIEALHENEAF